MRRKFIIGPSLRRSRDWIRQYHLGSEQYTAVIDMDHLRGIAAKNMEFVLLDGYWLNGVFQDNNDYYFYKFLLKQGAIENRVYGV